MNELVESDPELYGADTEEMHTSKKTEKKDSQKERDKLKADIKNHLKTDDQNAPGIMTSSAAND